MTNVRLRVAVLSGRLLGCRGATGSVSVWAAERSVLAEREQVRRRLDSGSAGSRQVAGGECHGVSGRVGRKVGMPRSAGVTYGYGRIFAALDSRACRRVEGAPNAVSGR